MTVFLIFFLTLAISFAGSIQLGPVNVMVIRTALEKDYRSAILVGFGGSLPELLYAMVALAGLTFLKHQPELLNFMNLLVVPFFLILGLYYLFPKVRKPKAPLIKRKHSFFSGFLLGLLNPQLLPFWLATLIYLQQIFPFSGFFQQTAFVLGTGAGAFVLLSLYAWLTFKKQEKLNSWLSKANFDIVTGITFLTMGALKLIF